MLGQAKIVGHQRRGRAILKGLGLAVFVLSLVALFKLSRADTDIGGTISSNTTLGPTGTPGFQDTVFNVVSNLTVNAGVTLTIQPGVTLKFNSGISLTVNGVLNAQGTATERIRFTRRAASGNWQGIFFSGSGTNASVLSHCDIEFAGSSGAAVWFTGSSATMSDCTVTNSGGDGVRIDGSSANPTLTDVTISNNGDSERLRQRAGNADGLYDTEQPPQRGVRLLPRERSACHPELHHQREHQLRGGGGGGNVDGEHDREQHRSRGAGGGRQ